MSQGDTDEVLQGTNGISIRDAYIAMYYFIDAYWKRGGQDDGSITLLRHSLGPSADPYDASVLQTSDRRAGVIG